MLLIDFYNLLYEFRCEVTKNSINSLMKLINSYSIAKLKKIKIVVDGWNFKIKIKNQYIEILYSAIADNLILDIINKHPNKTFTVISADHNIINAAKLKHNKTQHPKKFLHELFEVNTMNIALSKNTKANLNQQIEKTCDYENDKFDEMMIKYTK